LWVPSGRTCWLTGHRYCLPAIFRSKARWNSGLRRWAWSGRSLFCFIWGGGIGIPSGECELRHLILRKYWSGDPSDRCVFFPVTHSSRCLPKCVYMW
jgi:hypothetical protein